MKLLLTTFKENKNSSNILINSINCNKLLLTNSYKTSEKMLDVINKYDYIIMFGKKPNAKYITIELYRHNALEKN